jgi:hypothetical protein
LADRLHYPERRPWGPARPFPVGSWSSRLQFSSMRRTVLVVGVLLLACGESAPPALVVGDVAFTRDQLLGLSDARKASLVHLTAFGLAVADSATDELGAPLIREWEDDRLLSILAAELTLEKSGIDDAVLRAQYLTDPAYQLTVRHILFFSERWEAESARAEARAKAERALDLLEAGADFAETAASLSEEPGAEGRQGLLTPGREGAWVDEFWAAASALSVGEISPVTETRYGFHILRLEGREVVPFEEERSRVARDVADQVEDPRAVLDAWLDTERLTDPDARRAAALQEAHRRSLTIADGERAALRRRWNDLVYRWSAALGFATGLSHDRMADAALAALGATGQGAEIARNEMEAHAELLERRYPPETPPQGQP